MFLAFKVFFPIFLFNTVFLSTALTSPLTFAKLTFRALLTSQNLQPHSSSLGVDDSPLCLASPPLFTFRLLSPVPLSSESSLQFCSRCHIQLHSVCPHLPKRPLPPKEQAPAACKMIVVGRLPSPGPLLKAFLGSKWVEGGTNCSVY